MKIKRRKGNNPLAKLFAGPTSVEAEAEYKKLMIVEDLLKFMELANVNRSELAKRMGVKPSRVTSMLSGSNNFTIETLVRAGRAVGADLHQTFAPTGQKLRWIAFEPNAVHDAFGSDIKPHKLKHTEVEFTNLATPASDDDSKAA